MKTISFQISDEANSIIEKYAKELKRSKGFIIREAVEAYLEDIDEYFEISEYLSTHDSSENISYEEVKRRNGLV